MTKRRGRPLRTTLWRAVPEEALVIDLPTYQLPTVRLALSVMWTRLKGFLQTAGGIIVSTVVVVWLVMAIPVGAAAQADAREAGMPEQLHALKQGLPARL